MWAFKKTLVKLHGCNNEASSFEIINTTELQKVLLFLLLRLKPNLYTNVANFGLYNKTWNYYLNLNPFLKARKSITTSHLKTIEFSSPKDARWWDLGSQMFIMDISKSVNLKWPQKRTLVFLRRDISVTEKNHSLGKLWLIFSLISVHLRVN